MANSVLCLLIERGNYVSVMKRQLIYGGYYSYLSSRKNLTTPRAFSVVVYSMTDRNLFGNMVIRII